MVHDTGTEVPRGPRRIPWMPLIAGAVVASAALGVSLTRRTADSEGSSATSTTIVAVTTTVAPPTTPVPTVPPTTTPTLTRTISDGMSGEDVRLVQQRLIDLKFDPGPVDGIYGLQTRQAVWAFQKLMLATPREMIGADVTPELWGELTRPWMIAPRHPDLTETQVEIYLPEQVLVVFESNRPTLITHISSGTNTEWCEEVTIEPGEYRNETGTEPLIAGMCGLAKTTGGTFNVVRELRPEDDPDGDGWRTGALGQMYRPVYWNYGLAIHGSAKVPNEPASHGCVRIPMHVAEYFPELVDKGDSVWVWDGLKVPEAYGAPPPENDRFVDADEFVSTVDTTA